MSVRTAARAVLIVVLVAAIYTLDRLTGLVPDLTALYLIPVILATYWFGLAWGIGIVLVALAAQVLAHPAAHRPVILADAATHLAVFVFAAAVTAQLLSQLRQIRVLNDRRASEIEIARRVYAGLAAQEATTNPRLEVARRLQMAQELGGDYLLVRDTGRGTFVCISDIAGKGISAALFTALLEASLAAALEATDDPAEVVKSVNERMYASLPDSMFVTALGLLFLESEVMFVNAGHEPGLLLAAAGGDPVELLSDGGRPLGIDRELAIAVTTHPFGPGDAVVAFTDGVVDSPAFRGDRDLLAETVGHLAKDSAEDIADALLVASTGSGEPLRDDVTIVVVKAVGPAAAE